YPFAHFLFDVARAMAGGLEDLGHATSIARNRIDRSSVNVLVGIHLLDSPRWVEQMVDSGARYVVLQTEMVHGRAINQTPLGDRLDAVVLPLLRSAHAVWDSSEDNVAALAALGIESKILRFGYHRSLHEIRHKVERDVDFFWYGSITPHRRA